MITIDAPAVNDDILKIYTEQEDTQSDAQVKIARNDLNYSTTGLQLLNIFIHYTKHIIPQIFASRESNRRHWQRFEHIEIHLYDLWSKMLPSQPIDSRM